MEEIDLVIAARDIVVPAELVGDKGFNFPLNDHWGFRFVKQPERASIPTPDWFGYISHDDGKSITFSGRANGKVPWFHVKLLCGEKRLRTACTWDYKEDAVQFGEGFAEWIEDLLNALPAFWPAAIPIRREQDEKLEKWQRLLGFPVSLPEDLRRDFHHDGARWLESTREEVEQFLQAGEPLPDLSGHSVDAVLTELRDAWDKTPTSRALDLRLKRQQKRSEEREHKAWLATQRREAAMREALAKALRKPRSVLDAAPPCRFLA